MNTQTRIAVVKSVVKPTIVKPIVKIVKKAKRVSKPTRNILQAKTTRATMILLLQKNKGKAVSFSVIRAAVAKVKGWDDAKKIASRVKKHTKSVSTWAAQHDMKLNATATTLRLQ